MVFRAKPVKAEPDVPEPISLPPGRYSNFMPNESFWLIIVRTARSRPWPAKRYPKCLRCVREHLEADGRFIINVFRPYAVLDESWCYPETLQWERDGDRTGGHVVKKHRGEKSTPFARLSILI